MMTMMGDGTDLGSGSGNLPVVGKVDLIRGVCKYGATEEECCEKKRGVCFFCEVTNSESRVLSSAFGERNSGDLRQ